jgi:ATP-dependent Lon protease
MSESTMNNRSALSPGAGGNAAATEDRPETAGTGKPLPADALIIVPVRNVVLFPGMVFPLTVGRERSRAAAYEAARQQRPLGVLLQSKPETEQPGSGRPALGRHHRERSALHHGAGWSAPRHLPGRAALSRAAVPGGLSLHGRPRGARPEPAQTDPDIEGRAHGLKARAAEILALLPQVPDEGGDVAAGIEGPARLADFIAGLMDIGAEEKQSLLETFDLKARLDKLLELLAHSIEVLKVSRDVAERTKGSLDDLQRKHLLREQMRTIQKELGEGEEGAAELAELDKAITAAKMPEEVEKQARKELKRLERMPEGAGEYSMIRTYLDWLIDLPWAAAPERRSTSPRRGASSTRTTTASRRSRSAFSSTSRCASSILRARVPSCALPDRPAWARPRSGRASPRRRGASSSG